MKLISVNIGKERSIANAKASGKTGIYKIPVQGPVQITSLGIPEDAVCDKRHHGGVDQAIYVYGLDDYQWWSTTLEKTLSPGTFGDNLTISGLESATFQVGDLLKIGTVILQITSPRMPCVTLAARMGDEKFMERYLKAERPGLYCRVLQGGVLQAGETVHLERYTGETVTILQLFREYDDPTLSEATLNAYLAAPISERARAKKEKQLQKLLGQAG